MGRRRALFALALTGCTLVYGDLGKFTEGSPSGTDAGNVDSAEDVVVGDASTTPADAGLVATCRDVDAAFCDDFDDGRQEVVGPWTSTNEVEGALRLEGTVVRSAPRSLEASYPAGVTPPVGDCNYVRVLRQMGSKPTSRMELAFDLFLGDPDGGSWNGTGVAHLGWTHPDSSLCVLVLGPDPSQGMLLEQHSPNVEVNHFFPTSSPQTGAWHRWVIGVDFADNARLDVSIDGTRLFASEHLSGSCTTPGDLLFSVGLYCPLKRATPTRARYDNVVFDRRP